MFSVQEITSKWMTVRDNYTRSLKKQEKNDRSGSAAERVAKYTYDARLGIFKKCKEPRISESIFIETSTPSNIPLLNEKFNINITVLIFIFAFTFVLTLPNSTI